MTRLSRYLLTKKNIFVLILPVYNGILRKIFKRNPLEINHLKSVMMDIIFYINVILCLKKKYFYNDENDKCTENITHIIVQ